MENLEDLLQAVDQIRLGIHKGVHAPHKPLLILYALGKFVRGNKKFPYQAVHEDLTRLLREFGPRRKSHHPEYPFWRLQNDDLWEVESDGHMAPRKSNSDIPPKELREKNAIGKFAPEVEQILSASLDNVGSVTQRLLDMSFPSTLHEDILHAVGLSLGQGSLSRKRSPDFRERVLRAYRYQCSVCGYDLRMGDRPAGLEAAHIMWHQVGGPDIEANGLALCVLHHKLFDLGVFTIDGNTSTILCSEELNGKGNLEWILNYHGRALSRPQRRDYAPEGQYVDWHRRNRFREPVMER